MNRLSQFGFAWTVLWFLFATPVCAQQPTGVEFFEQHVRPLLIEKCSRCHSGEKAGGGLSLGEAAGWRKGGESGPAITPGKPNESLLIEAINYGSLEMPPPDDGGQLSRREIKVLTDWVSMGAPDPRTGNDAIAGMSREQAESWWSFQPLQNVNQSQREVHELAKMIDGFIDRSISQRGLPSAGVADKYTLIRRATYDLTGLPPTTEEVNAFLEDESPDAWDRVLDRLLQSPHYGERWGRHWLDVVRYADTAGENTDRPLPHAWRYRNWVIDAFNRDMPWDEFLRLQLAGDLIEAGTENERRAEGIIATGYLAVARRFGHDIDKDIHLMHEDVIDNLGKNMLGLSFGCARCHDHKYDPITSEDYYALYGVFSSTRFSFPGCEPRGQPKDNVPLIDPKVSASMQAEYDAKKNAYDEQIAKRNKAPALLKELALKSFKVLDSGDVGEGMRADLFANNKQEKSVSVAKGEVIQLTILRNSNHGADSTRVELVLNRDDGETWNVDDLIDRFSDDGPIYEDRGAHWCMTHVTNGPVFLTEKTETINGNTFLKKWGIGDTPSAFVNASQSPISLWTTLPARAFFLHPGPAEDVAVSWVCPQDGNYTIRGLVEDAHPAGGLDGVKFRLEHFSSPELGEGLVNLGNAVRSKPIEPPTMPMLPVAYAVADSTPVNEKLHQRGDPEQPGDEVLRRWLNVFGGNDLAFADRSGRQELADHITSHPLMSRVMVNRIWKWHFGRGIVATPNDFGSRGSKPSHPALLEWLAAEFASGDFRVKRLHRAIMKTAAYRRASQLNADSSSQLVSADPDNRWLARFNRRRLSAEEIRDSLLVAAGNLDDSSAQQHPFPPASNWTYTQHNPFTAVYETNRRSVYLMVQRQRRHPYLALFDGADPNSSTANRRTTTVPTQALYFLNDPFFHNQAMSLAKLAIKECNVDGQLNSDLAIKFITRRVFQRDPNDLEIKVAGYLLSRFSGSEEEKWAAVARVMLASNQFVYLD